MHAGPARSHVNKAALLVQASPRRVRGQGHVSAGWCVSSDVSQESIEDRAADPSALVCRECGHVSDEEVPGAVPDDPSPTGDDTPWIHDVSERPGARQRTSALLLRLGCQATLASQPQVVSERWWTFDETVSGMQGHSTSVSGDRPGSCAFWFHESFRGAHGRALRLRSAGRDSGDRRSTCSCAPRSASR